MGFLNNIDSRNSLRHNFEVFRLFWSAGEGVKLHDIVVKKINEFRQKETPDLDIFSGDSQKLRNAARDSSTLICYNIISIFSLGLGVKSAKISLPFIYPPCNNPLDRQIRCHRISKEALKQTDLLRFSSADENLLTAPGANCILKARY